MKSLSKETLFFSSEVLGLLHFISCQNCMSSANLVAESFQKLWEKKGFEHYGQQLLRFLRVHQCNPNQMKISKDQSTQTTARAVGMAFYLWLPFLNQRSAQLNKVNKHCIRSIFGQHLFCLLRPHQRSSAHQRSAARERSQWSNYYQRSEHSILLVATLRSIM